MKRGDFCAASEPVAVLAQRGCGAKVLCDGFGGTVLPKQ
jgi:hypothetical protein